ncbi:T9SS type A sorting domain-containing protein [Bacteroidia bacterium]|nr:T9SS type A sorting domain-containing protein [Bacteroidia bacterium]
MKVKIVLLSFVFYIAGALKADNGTIQILPNPANKQVTISVEEQQLVTIELYSILGQKILTHTSFGISTTLDIHKVPNGLYLVNVSFGDSMVVHRLKINH